MRITNSLQYTSLQTNIETSLGELNTVQRQISTGKKLTDFSDDPSGASQSLALRSALADNSQYQRDADSAKSYLSAADGALLSVSTVVQSARQIAVQGANSSQSPDSLKALSSQVDGIIQQVTQLANTDLHGTYLFGGTQTKTPPSTPLRITRATPSRSRQASGRATPSRPVRSGVLSSARPSPPSSR